MSIAEITPPTTTELAPKPAADLKIVSDATCTFCGCVCDDMELTVEGNKITKAKNACVLGKAWFFNHHIEDRPEATIEGRPVSYEEAFDAAADILLSARYPVTYGLSDTTCEAQRVAVRDRIKEQFHLFADRMSTETMRANQLRLYLSAMAYVLVSGLRRLGLKATELAQAQAATIRTKLFKIGALVRVSVRRVWLSMASSYPWQPLFQQVWTNLRC